MNDYETVYDRDSAIAKCKKLNRHGKVLVGCIDDKEVFFVGEFKEPMTATAFKNAWSMGDE
jgi:uracil-DNA glycosylase